ncbi:MAG: 2-aminoethylphosphonate--pyruvate transaminase [Chloroflexi bacterium]|nr:2-aminoethylphosphonate--pyruvate transaminase [Chloroflexota bacterium]
MQRIRPARDKLLFTPGPATTSATVKQAMLRDAGSWHVEFNELVRSVRERLLALAGVSREGGYEVVLMQGSGTFGVEAIAASVVPRDGKLLIVANGAYGERAVLIAKTAGIPHAVLRYPEDTPAEAAGVRAQLGRDAAITHVLAVHCETTTGLLNPIEEIGRAVREQGRSYIVDAMSSFGAIPIDFAACGIDYLVSSANKCIEGVPGFSFVFARREALLASEGNARSFSLDLLGQWRGFEKNGQFRFTPPTHVILAFDQALRELEAEGGIAGRGARYRANHAVLIEGMRALGFRPYLRPEVQSYIITAFHYPPSPRFDFERFYRGLSDRGMIIYPGKLTEVPCFRIGTIGRLFEPEIRRLLGAVGEVMAELGCRDD